MTREQAIQLLINNGYAEDTAIALVNSLSIVTDVRGVPTGEVNVEELNQFLPGAFQAGAGPEGDDVGGVDRDRITASISRSVASVAEVTGGSTFNEALLTQLGVTPETVAAAVSGAPIPPTIGEGEVYIDPGGGWFVDAGSQQRQAEILEEWNKMVVGAGIDDLGVPTNWWPGLNLMAPIESPHSTFSTRDPDTGAFKFERHRSTSQFWEDAFYPETSYVFTDPTTEEKSEQWVRYNPEVASQMFYGMSDGDRADMYDKLASNGMLAKGWKGTIDYTAEGAAAFGLALRWANYYGEDVSTFLEKSGARFAARSGGSGSGRRIVVEVPDYDTHLANARTMLANQVGRDPKDWELAMLADEMQRQWGTYAAAKRRALRGNGVYEVPDPNALSAEFMKSKYADEIERLKDVGDTRANNALLLNAATKGLDMMGGLGRG